MKTPKKKWAISGCVKFNVGHLSNQMNLAYSNVFVILNNPHQVYSSTTHDFAGRFVILLMLLWVHKYNLREII